MQEVEECAVTEPIGVENNSRTVVPHLINARDLAEACASIGPGKLLRTANPFSMTPLELPSEGLVHLLDLRHPDEYARDDTSRWKDCIVKERVFDRVKRSKELQAQERVFSQSSSHTDGKQFIVSRISVLDRERIQKGLLFKKMDAITSSRVLFYLMFDIVKMQALVIREINAGGLLLLYKLIMDTSGPELAKALDVVLEAVEAGQPVVFFCKLGKDRTGLLAAMILSIVGASDAAIVLDYATSDGTAQAGLGDLESDRRISGVDKRQFSRAPAAVMKATLAYCCKKYGSVSEYLSRVGFGVDKQARLRKALQE